MIILTTTAFYLVLFGILLTLIGLATFRDSILIFGIAMCLLALVIGMVSASVAVTKKHNEIENWH